MLRRFIPCLLPLVVVFVLSGLSLAQETVGKNGKSGFGKSQGFGGPTSVGAQLEEDDEIKEPAVRISEIDAFIQPWFDWKKGLNDNYGFQLGLDYMQGHYVQEPEVVLQDKDDSEKRRTLEELAAANAG